jgi:hypothetical protein
MRKLQISAVALLLLAFAAEARSQDVRQYTETRDGVTYRVTHRTVKRPTLETRLEPREQTVYRERYSSEVCESDRVVYAPVTEYRWQPVMHGRWNPLVQPYYQYHLVPTTRWESRVETVRVPLARRELVPETKVTHVPVTSTRMVEEEVIQRVAITPSQAGNESASIARRDVIGGETVRILPADRPTSLGPTQVR